MFKIYYTNENGEARSCDADDLVVALNGVETLRQNPRNSFVTMVSENPNSVGKPGVDTVTAGKLPDGADYTWMKRRKQ